MRKLAAIALTFTLLGCAQTPTATQSPEAPTATINAQSPEPTVVNGKNLVPTADSDESCELPQPLVENELFNRIITAPLGSSPEAVQKYVGKPADKPLSTTQNISLLTWTDNYYPRTVEMWLSFKDGKLIERFIAFGENVGQDNEKICSWRSRD